MEKASKQFWVVGGEFSDTRFNGLVPGTERVLGPFAARRDAETAWSRLASETRSLCNARFSITEEQLR